MDTVEVSSSAIDLVHTAVSAAAAIVVHDDSESDDGERMDVTNDFDKAHEAIETTFLKMRQILDTLRPRKKRPGHKDLSEPGSKVL